MLIILGPFTINHNRLQGVQFTIPVVVGSYGLVVPLRQNYNLAAILHAFEFKVWLVILMTIPTYILVMTMANYHHFGHMKWEIFASFVIRSSIMERRGKSLPVKRLYQKLLLLFWSLPLFVLVTAYKGNMTALITKPNLQKPIKDVNELVNQNEMSWTVEEGSSMLNYLKSAPTGTGFTIAHDNEMTDPIQ